MRRIRAAAQISMWVALSIAFICVGAPKILQRAPKGSIAPRGDLAFHTSDTLFLYASGSSYTSRRLIESFESAPSGKRIVILEQDDDPESSLLGMLTAYVAWPRPVEIVDLAHKRVSPGNQRAVDLSPPAAIVVCRVSRPANLPEGKHFGSGIEVIPVTMNKP